MPGTKLYLLTNLRSKASLRQEIGDKSGYRFNKNKVKRDAGRREIGTLG